MPEFYTDTKGEEILVVSYDELVPRFYKSVTSISTVVGRDEKRGRGMRRVRQGKGLDSVALIDFDTLPTHIQNQLFDPRRDQHPVDKFYRHNTDAEIFFRKYLLPDGRRISTDIQTRYTANASTLDAILRLKEAREREFARCGKRAPHLWEGLCNEAQTFKAVQLKKYGYEHSFKDNHRRFKLAADTYANAKSREEAFASLISQQHISNSVAGARKVDKKTEALFESMFAAAGEKPNYLEVYNNYCDFLDGRKEFVVNATAEILDPSLYKPVSESTVRSYLAKWESKAATLRLRTGDRQILMSELTPYHGMESGEWAGSLLSIDDRQPPFEYEPGKRAWFYVGYDLAADCYTTIVWGRDKEGMILDFYRQMCRNYAQWGVNLPAELEAESNLNASFKDTFLREGNMFQYVHISANNARTKKIENRNRAMRYGVERKDEGWKARPFAKDESNRKGSDKEVLIPFETIVARTLKHYEDWNNQPHPRYPEMTRWEFFMKRQHPNLRTTNWEGIIPYLGIDRKSSCRTGIVRLNNSECLLGMDGEIALGEDLISLMKLAEGQDLNIKWLDGNDGKILKAYAYIGDVFICELLPKPSYKRARIEQTDADLEARKLMSSYVATIESFGKRRKNEIEKITVLEGKVEEKRTPEFTFSMPQLYREEREYINADAVVFDDEQDDDFNHSFNGVERSFKRSLVETF